MHGLFGLALRPSRRCLPLTRVEQRLFRTFTFIPILTLVASIGHLANKYM